VIVGNVLTTDNGLERRIRRNILPEGEVAVRKTFSLTEPGCNVNCKYCTVAQRYVGEWNRNLIREGVEQEISEFREQYPDVNIELVAYWHGINRRDAEFERLLNIIETSGYSTVGGDLGIILDETILRDLKQAGLAYIQNNLETSQELYPRIVGIQNARRFYQKIETLRLANEVGLDITSGILIGVGEGPEDIIEQVNTLRGLPLKRVVVNLMDYETDPEIAEQFDYARGQLTTEYALQVLAFLRDYIHPDQSLMVGSGVGRYFHNRQMFSQMLEIADTVHIGAFINLIGSNGVAKTFGRLDEAGYAVVPTPCFA